jgi:hypothetical protein
VKPTGMTVAPEELERALELHQEARTAPVMTVRSDLPTFAEVAQRTLQEYVDSLAVARGLPAHMSWGLRPDGMIMADDSWEPEGSTEAAS